MIFNLDSLHYIARRPVWAISLRERLRGMIGRRFEPDGIDAMIFPHCNAVHTMGMLIPIDLLFLDADSKVTKLCSDLTPWHVLVSCRRAVTVIELPAGKIVESGTEIGHHLNLNSVLSPEMIEKLRKRAILSAGNAGVLPSKACCLKNSRQQASPASLGAAESCSLPERGGNAPS